MGAWSCGVAKEKSLAVVLANEKIEVAVAIDIGQGWAGVAADIRNPEGLVSTISGVSRSSRRTGVAEEFGCAVSIADEEIEVAIVIEIRQGRPGTSTNISDPKGTISLLLECRQEPSQNCPGRRWALWCR